MKKTFAVVKMHSMIVIGLATVLLSSECFSQTDNDEERKKNRLSLAITHTFVPTAIDELGKKKWLSLASWGLDYDREFNSAWGIGLHSDIVIENFQYEDGDVIKERKSPLALALVGSRKFGEHISVLVGGGFEVSKGEETLGLIRIGADCGWEIPGDWEVSFSLMTDFKINAYDAFVFGFGIGKKF